MIVSDFVDSTYPLWVVGGGLGWGIIKGAGGGEGVETGIGM